MKDEDLFAEAPRMNTYMNVQDLNLDGCINLCSVILEEAAKEYIIARHDLNRLPHSRDAQEHYRICKKFYESDWFNVLSCGLMSGESVMRKLDEKAKTCKGRNLDYETLFS